MISSGSGLLPDRLQTAAVTRWEILKLPFGISLHQLQAGTGSLLLIVNSACPVFEDLGTDVTDPRQIP